VAKIDGGTKDNGSRNLNDVDLVRGMGLGGIMGEGDFVSDSGVDCGTA